MSGVRLLLGGLCGAACLLTGTAAAESPTTQPAAAAPAPAAAPPTRSLLDIDALSLDLGFEARFDEQRVRDARPNATARSYRQTNRDRSFEETVGFAAAGSAFGPDLLLFDTAARWGLVQEYYRESGTGPDRRERSSGDLLEYDLSFTLLPRGKLTATATALRQDSRVPRAFLPSLDRSQERYGVDLIFNDPVLPMRLSYEHVYDELRSRTRQLRDDERRASDRLRYEATWQSSPNHALRFEYEYEDRDERYSGSRTRFDTRRHYLTLTDTLRFGRDNKSLLETLARLQDEKGELGRDIAEVATHLRLQHTDAFSTFYKGQYLRDAFQQLKTETWRGELGATHQLGERLTTSASLYGLRQQADDNADFAEWGGLASLNYTQPNDWGRFSASASYNYAHVSTDDGRRRGVVIGESVTLRDPLASFLVHSDIDPLSIVVTDAARRRTYLPGRDYNTARLGRYTSLRRVPTGAIADRETVLVSYTYRVSDDYSLRRHRGDFRIQQEFTGGLTPYYTAALQDEELTGRRFQRWRERDISRHRLGATYRQKRWSVGGEYEYNDDTIDPYQAGHVNGDVVLWQDGGQQLDGRTSLAHYWFDGTGDLEQRRALLVDAGLSYRYVISQSLEANAAALYRFEDDSLLGRTHGCDLTAALEWKLGYFSLRFEAEYDLLDLPSSRDTTASFWLKLKREIPIITRRSS
jgi:hypothetical protein